jgi:hypothetical protein
MFTKSQINNMNYDTKFSSLPWIKIIENKNINRDDINRDDIDLYKLYPTNNFSISSGREYIALPADKILSSNDFFKYNINK